MMSGPFYICIDGSPRISSIIDISRDVISILRSLSEKEPMFSSLEVVLEKGNFLLEDIFSETAYEVLAEKILLRNLRDIKKYNNKNPDINFYREEPCFTFSLLFRSEDGKKFCLVFSVGSSSKWKVTTLSMDKGYRPVFFWFKNILDSFIEKFPVKIASVRLDDLELSKRIRNLYKFPLGWINYISDGEDIVVPEVLPYVKYEKKFNGMMFYLTKEDFSTSEDNYRLHVKKLEEVMEALKSCSPNYGVA